MWRCYHPPTLHQNMATAHRGLSQSRTQRYQEMKCSYSFKIWQAFRQHYYRDAWQISERLLNNKHRSHYNGVIMSALASQINSLTIVYSAVYSGADQGKHQSSASLAFVRGIQRWPVNSPHKWPVTRKMFPFNDVITIRGLSCDFERNQEPGMFHSVNMLDTRGA